MKPVSKIQKGKNFEKFFVEKLRNTGLDPMASRTPGSGSGLKKGDIFTSLPYSFELKAHKKSSVLEWFKQCEEDCKTIIGGQPCVIWKPDNENPENSIVMIRLFTFLELLKQSKQPTTIDTDNKELKYLLPDLRNKLRKLLKIIES